MTLSRILIIAYARVRYATLPNIMKAKKKKVDVRNADDFGVDISPRIRFV